MKMYPALTIIIFAIFISCKKTDKNQDKVQTMKILSDSAALPVVGKEKIETIIYDLNDDNIVDSINLTTPPESGDQGEFQNVILSLSGSKRQSFSSKDVWDNIDKDFIDSNYNAVKSNRVFVFKDPNQVLILLFGFPYGSGREEFSIIQIENKIAKMVFDYPLQFPIRLYDFDKDGKIDFLGRNAFEIYKSVDSLNGDIGSYSPYLIYTIDNEFKLNESLTKKFNEENFVFAGYKGSTTKVGDLINFCLFGMEIIIRNRNDRRSNIIPFISIRFDGTF